MSTDDAARHTDGTEPPRPYRHPRRWAPTRPWGTRPGHPRPLGSRPLGSRPATTRHPLR